MNPELKAKWVEALRSGKYSQTTGTLKNSCGYCCLGVLCDVVDSTAWDIGNDWRHDEGTLENELSSAFRSEIGMSGSHESALISLNDDEKKSFDEIAAYIEVNL